MKKIYYLNTCDTCKRILKQLPIDDFELQNIKGNPITEKELDHIYQTSGSYENLFNKRAQKYKLQNLKEQDLTEEDYKKLILEEYTFLKRPVAIVDDKIFIGNSKKTVEELVQSCS